MSAEDLTWLQENTRIGFTSKRGNAWHARGVTDDNGLPLNHFEYEVPIEEVVELFDFPLVRAELTASYETERGVRDIHIGDRTAVVRGDTGDVFGIFSRDGYQIHQPQKWLVDTVSDILDASDDQLAVGSAGLLKLGARNFVQFELEETFRGVEGIEHRPFLTAATSHDGSLATTYIVGTQVVVCDNTLTAALGTATNKRKIKHSANSLKNIQQVRDDLSLVLADAADEFDAEVKTLLDQHVTDAQWAEFTSAFANPTGKEMEPGRGLTMFENKVGALNRLWIADERVAPWKNTAWGVVQAVNTFVAHEQSVKGVSREERNYGRTLDEEWEKLSKSTLLTLDKIGAIDLGELVDA